MRTLESLVIHHLAGFVGVDRFVYSITDDAVAPSNPAPATDSATVYLVVFAGNNTYAINDINNTFVDVPVTGNVLTNDFDITRRHSGSNFC